MKRFALLTLLLLAAPCWATDPVPAPAIIFPDLPAAPTPAPTPPNPAAPVQLNDGVYYVIRSAQPILAMASPAGVLTLTKESGPLRIRGKFVDGTGKVETRNFAEKYLLIVEATGSGKAELFVAASPVTDEAQVAKKCIQANTTPEPPPQPPAPTDPLSMALQVAWAKESTADKAKLLDLTMLYSEAAKPKGAVYTSTKATAKLFHDDFKVARVALVGESLPAVRKVLQTEMDATLPTAVTAPLDAPTRDKIAAKFNQIAQSLGGLK